MAKDSVPRLLRSLTKLVIIGLVVINIAPQAGAEENDWSGLYIGGSVGVNGRLFNSTWGEVLVPERPYGDPRMEFVAPSSNELAMIGFHAGYLQQWGDFAAGPEVAWSGTGLAAGYHEIAPLGTAGMRAGYALQRLFLSASSGYVTTEVSLNYPSYGGTQYSDRVQHSGWYYGFGGEYLITSYWSLGFEYMHHDFSKEQHRISVLAPPGDDVELEIEAVRIRASFHL